MSKFNYNKILAFIVPILFMVPLFIFAESSGPTIQNPLGSSDVNVLLGRIMKLVSQVGAVIVVFFIIYSGYKFVSAGDSDPERTKAKDIFYATVIGGAILLGANIIASVVVGTVNSIK